jgi:hypothetical protein
MVRMEVFKGRGAVGGRVKEGEYGGGTFYAL